MVATRKCHGCANVKPVEEFSKQSKNKCLECYRAQARKNYAANPLSKEKTAERQRRFRENNPDKIAAAKAKYKNKDK